MPTTEESKQRQIKPSQIPGQIDPDVVIPPSVRAAAARAEAAHKAAYPDQSPSSQPNADGTPSPSMETMEKPSSAPASVGPTGSPPAGAPPPSSSGAPAPASSPASSSANEQAPEPANWEHRYISMKGRYDKTQDEIRRMGEQITNLQNVLATVNSAPQAPAAPKELQASSLLTPQEISDYGEEFLDVVGKKAREIAAQTVSGLQNEISSLKQQLGHVGGSIAQSGRERMFSSLDQQLPQWRQVNNDRKFIEWLALPDVYSGAIRHNLLKAAWERNDTPRALAFFQGFLAEEAAVDPAARPPNGSRVPDVALNGGQRSNGKVPLETFAAPGRAKSAAETPAEKPLISRSQISAFYAQCSAGKFRGNEAERVRLEKMIFDAQAEGRIVN